MGVNEHIYDVIIIGGGPAGLVAGLYSRRAAMDTLLLEKGVVGGQIAISKDVENYPGIEGITGFDLAESIERQARSFGLVIEQQEVVAVMPGDMCHTVRLANGGSLCARAVILATGGTARTLGIPGEREYAGSGVSYCATCDGQFFAGRTVAVVGGGDTAVEEAVYLARICKKVFVVHRQGMLTASRLLQERLLAEPAIEVLWRSAVREVRGDGESVTSVGIEALDTGERTDLEVDGVFIFIGYEPSSRLVPAGIEKSAEGFVVTDEKGATTIPGIFVAGDLRRKYANQIVIAAADGAVAGLAASRYVETGRCAGHLTCAR